MDATDYRYDVFISCSRSDDRWVTDWLVPRLESAVGADGQRLRVCLERRDLDVGTPALVNLERAVQQSRKTLLVLSPAWLESEWTDYVSLLTGTRDPAGLRRRMLPLLLRPCQPPKRVSIFTCADFTNPAEWEDQYRRILDAVLDKVNLPEEEVASDRVAARRGVAVAGNLPSQLTSFIGREDESRRVKELLQTARLLTLTGAPGAGKTRLALAVAESTAGSYGDGAWLVELSGLQDRHAPDAVASAVARALCIDEKPGRPILESLVAGLQPKQLLLVLDNCESVVSQCASLAEAILPLCPGLHILATSREALDTPAEVVWEVQPLALPQGRRPSPQDVAASEAGRLFCDRARQRQPVFTLTEGNAGAVLRICQRLSGLPLAIELAAAWVRTLPVEEIERRLQGRLWQLTGENRAALPHQRTLHDAIAWSYDLLSPAEGALFDRLSVFDGGFTLQAAEAIGPGPKVQPYEVLDLLEHLVDKSLVVAEATQEGSIRYRLLQPLREYGWERLAAGADLSATRRGHALFYLTLAETAAPRLQGSEQMLWQNRLEAEYENLRAALAWADEASEAEYLVQLAGALGRFWWLRGYLADGRQWLEHSLALDSEAPAAFRARAQYYAGRIASRMADLAKAQGLFAGSAEQYRMAGDRAGRAAALYALGVVESKQGRYERASVLLEEAVAAQREVGDKKGLADSLYYLGVIASMQGDFATACARYNESLPLFAAFGHRLGIANVEHALGMAKRYQGQLTEARALFESCLGTYRELNHRPGIAFTLNNLGNVAMDQGDYASAHTCFSESLGLALELGATEGIPYLLESLAGLAACESRAKRAACLFGAAEALREAIGEPLPAEDRPSYDRNVAATRAALRETEFNAEWSRGRAMGLGEATAYALAE